MPEKIRPARDGHRDDRPGNRGAIIVRGQAPAGPARGAPIDLLLARLQGIRASGPQRWVSRCPAHDDRGPSLSLRELPDGRVLLHCFAGCDVQDVLYAVDLALADLYPERPAHHLTPVIERHRHAGADVLALLAREALAVAVAAEQVAAGHALSPGDRNRLYQSAGRIRLALDGIA